MSSNPHLLQFPDENGWPFLGREDQLNQCLRFLAPEQAAKESCLLHLQGVSGIGKSFFAKELICRFAAEARPSICLYLDVEESEFESTNLEKRLSLLAMRANRPTRTDPQNVPADAGLIQFVQPPPPHIRVLHDAYKAARVLSVFVPYAGKALQGNLPPEIPGPRFGQINMEGRVWEYLIHHARTYGGILTLDNCQFLSQSLRLQIDQVLCSAELGFRLILVERTQPGMTGKMFLRCFGSNRLSLELQPLSEAVSSDIVRRVAKASRSDLTRLSEVLSRTSEGNPKQLWLQLRALQRNSTTDGKDIPANDYEETISQLRPLDRTALQVTTILMGELKLNDMVAILKWIVHPIKEDDIRRTILDLALIGLLVVNGSASDRVRTEHELVRSTVKTVTLQPEALALREQLVAALVNTLESHVLDEEYDRLADRLVGLLSPEDLKARHDLLGHLIGLIDRQYSTERFHYLLTLYSHCHGSVYLLPEYCQVAFLDTFQKTSQFDDGLAAVERLRGKSAVSDDRLNLFAAKYLVQKFHYNGAKALLKTVARNSEQDMVLFNIVLNICADDEAREMIASLPQDENSLDEFHCVMLRNCGHLYDPVTAKLHLGRALAWFRNQHLKFGIATTLNNLGAVDISSKQLEEGRKHCIASLDLLRALSSNEAFQPINNLGVLAALEGNLAAGDKFFAEAQTVISRWLQMDNLVLRFNRLVVRLMDGSGALEQALSEVEKLYESSLAIKDKRFQDSLAWTANQIASAMDLPAKFDHAKDFEERYGIKQLCPFEVFVHAPVGDRSLKLLLVLSTHWRY